jgi:hypothetical protein
MVDHVRTTRTASADAPLHAWWLDNKKLDFPRGYHIEVGWRACIRPATASWAASSAIRAGRLRREAQGRLSPLLRRDDRLLGRGEQIPNDKCYTEIDPNVVDKFGIPVLRFHWEWTDNELNQVKHMQEDLPRR